MARPIITKKLVEVALAEGAVAICHGATGKGNDQVRFELSIKALAPHLKIIAPWRIWDIKSREDAIQYCLDRNISIPTPKSDSYSRDLNIWHISHEGLDIENPLNIPNYNSLLKLSNTPESAPEQPEIIEIQFKEGVPVTLNSKHLSPTEMLAKLNSIGGIHGIGTVDLIENRIVGMKSRGIYETPGGTILFAAHEELEHMCLDKDTYGYKQVISTKFAELVYNGQWFTPLREALSCFVDETQKTVSGIVKLKLYKGNIIPSGVSSPYSLYNEELSSFETGELYNHKDAEGFINLFGLPLKVRAMMNSNLKEI